MRSKLKSAPALLSILSLLLLMSAANVDDPTSPELSSSGERLDGGHDSYGTLKSAQIVPNVDSPKIFSSDQSNMAVGNPSDEETLSFESQNCTLKNDVLQKLRFLNESEWRINQTGLSLLRNDPQQLINCTDPGDRVIFELTGAYKFNRTLAVDRELEFISRSPETNKSNGDSKSVASFTCPDSVPFLTIQSANFTASGFFVENCTQKDINGTVVLDSNSEVDFNNFGFSNNKARAVYADDNVKLTLKSCRFENNTLSGGNGAAIYFPNNCIVTIVHSNFSSNAASSGNGGGVYGNTSNTLSIKHSTFSGNQASKGGAMFFEKNNSVNVDKSMFFKNNASSGGVLYFHENNTLTMRASNFTNNQAKETAAVIILMDNNNATIEEAEFSNNSAAGASVMLLYIHNNVTIISSSLTGNKAMLYGSAIYLYEHCILYIKKSNLLDNEGTLYGGALGANVFSSITLVNSSFIGNHARWGGALYIESNANVTISNSHFSKNNATRGGAIRLGMDCDMSIRKSEFRQNSATNGGCFSIDSSEIEVQGSNFTKNNAQELGGCFLADSSSIIVNKSTLSHNEADEGGGIYVSTRTFLHMEETTVSSNSANGSAGGLALMYDSRLLCLSCNFTTNTAMRGGGLYIQSHTKQLVVARLQRSIFEGNNASSFGGGMVVETIKTKRVNCNESLAPCSKVLLFGTNFTNNRASLSGSAILATTPSNVLVDCNAKTEHGSSVFISREILLRLQSQRIQKIDPKELCASWQGNSLPPDAPGDVIGTFGHHLVIKTVSSNGLQISGNHTSGFTLQNVRSAEQFPTINVTTIDAFENTPAPVLFEDDALQLVSQDGFLKNNVTFSFNNMSCVISSISANVPKDNYTIKIIPKDEDVLEQTELSISIGDCGINEELLDTNVCQACRNGSYDFDASKQKHCETCPKHADCDGMFLLVEEGYWQRSPCHHKVKKCIVKKACDYTNRTDNITTFIQNFTDCNFTKTNLEEYGKLQCRKGYKGPLCGSCKKSYGLSSKLECSKCGHAIAIVLRFLGALIYLLVGTIITMKGVLPSSSSRQKCEDVETPLLEPSSTASMDVGSSNQVREEEENGNQDPSQPLIDGEGNSRNIRSHGNDEIEVTKQTLISLNYFQVTSHAASMDVEWTKKLLEMLEGLNILGAATTEPISYSFDCLFSSSNASKAIWGVLLSLFVPTIVISLLSLYWGYKSLARHSENWVHFLRRLTLSVITVTYVAYFDLTQVAMRTFSCVVVHNNSDLFSTKTTTYWVGDTSIECYKSTHIVLVCISLVVVMLVTIGFPAATTFTLNHRKSEVRDTSTWTHDTLGFLGGPFKQRFIYWECVTMIKKAILSIIIVFSYSLEVQAQGLLILLVLVFFLYTHFLCYPYHEQYHTLNYYESGSLLVSCVTYTLIQFFNVERFSEVARSIISLSVIAINVGFICLMVYKIVKDVIHLLRVLLESQNVHIPKNMNVISLIRIYSKKQRSF